MRSARAGQDRRRRPLTGSSPFARAVPGGGPALVALVIIFAPTTLLSKRDSGSGQWVDLGVTGAIVALGVVSWLVTRWRVEGGD